MLSRSQHRDRRLREINKAHEVSHASFHREYRIKFLAACAKHGVTLTKMSDFFHFPLAFHEEMKPHQEELVRNLALAHQAKSSSAAQLPRVKYRRS